MLNRTKKAFTLLELIVVLLVLGVLAAIAVPTYNTLKVNSVKRSVNTTLQAIDRAGEASYASDTTMGDKDIATAAVVDMDDDAGTPGIQQGDLTISGPPELATVTVSLQSGAITCTGTVEFDNGVGTISSLTGTGCD